MSDYNFTDEQKEVMKQPIDWENPIMVNINNNERIALKFCSNGSLLCVRSGLEEEYLKNGDIHATIFCPTWTPISQPKTRPMTKDEILQLINDCHNIWIKDYNNYQSKIMQLDIEDDEDFVKLADVWYSIKELLSFTYSLTLLGGYKRFEVVE